MGFGVQGSRFKVQSIEIYDIFGRKLYEYNNSYGLMVLRSYGLTTDGVVYINIYLKNRAKTFNQLKISVLKNRLTCYL